MNGYEEKGNKKEWRFKTKCDAFRRCDARLTTWRCHYWRQMLKFVLFLFPFNDFRISFFFFFATKTAKTCFFPFRTEVNLNESNQMIKRTFFILSLALFLPSLLNWSSEYFSLLFIPWWWWWYDRFLKGTKL